MKYNLVLNASKNEFQSLAITGGHFEIWAILDSSELRIFFIVAMMIVYVINTHNKIVWTEVSKIFEYILSVIIILIIITIYFEIKSFKSH